MHDADKRKNRLGDPPAGGFAQRKNRQYAPSQQGWFGVLAVHYVEGVVELPLDGICSIPYQVQWILEG